MYAALSCKGSPPSATDASVAFATGGTGAAGSAGASGMSAPVIGGATAGRVAAAGPTTGGTGGFGTSPPIAGITGAGSSGTGGSSGSGDVLDPEQDAGVDTSEPPTAMPIFPPLETNGEPLPGERGTWTYTEFPESQCRDGSPAGVYTNLGTTNKLMIFLEGGGRCADDVTCAVFAANISAGEFLRSAQISGGVFDRAKAENPVRDWNIVYIPYCTGDRHGGANPNAAVPGVTGTQKFMGYSNMRKFLDRIVPTFRNTTDVLLTGVSAGGFGVAYNMVLVQRAFPNLKVRAIIDSGPFVSQAVFTACDQESTRTWYQADQTFLADCGAACPRPNDYAMDYGAFLAKTFADRPTGLISSTEDSVERAFFSIGLDDCTGPFDLLNPALPAAPFTADLLAYRKRIEPFPNASTFYPATDTHTFIVFDVFYTQTAGGVRLVDWFTKIVNGQSPGHAGP